MSDCGATIEPVQQVTNVTVERSCAVEPVRHVTEVEVQRARQVEVPRGPRGFPGEGASALLVEAGEAISAKRPVVVIDDLAYTADNTDPTHNGKVIGISDGAVSQGDEVTIKTDGARLENNTWNWTGGLLYVGAGALTETVPTTGFSQSIAVAVASDALIVQLGPPIGRV
jgi:hypothetical protein